MKTVALLAGLSTLFSLVSAGYVESAASYDTHIARLRHRRAYAGRRHRRRDGEASSTPIQTRMVADTEYTTCPTAPAGKPPPTYVIYPAEGGSVALACQYEVDAINLESCEYNAAGQLVGSSGSGDFVCEPRSFARTGNPSCYTACATTGLSGYELDLTRGNSFVQNEDSNVYGEHTYTYCSYIASGATNPSAFCAYSAATGELLTDPSYTTGDVQACRSTAYIGDNCVGSVPSYAIADSRFSTCPLAPAGREVKQYITSPIGSTGEAVYLQCRHRPIGSDNDDQICSYGRDGVLISSSGLSTCDPTSYARTDGRQCFTEVPLSFNDYTLKTVNSQLFAQYDLLSPPKSFDITVYGEYVKDGVSSFCPYDAATGEFIDDPVWTGNQKGIDCPLNAYPGRCLDNSRFGPTPAPPPR